jgi:subtilisin family serine protease
MRRRSWHGWWWIALAVLLAACGQTQDVAGVGIERAAGTRGAAVMGEAEAATAWFVEFASPPSVRGGSPSVQASERALLRSEARAERVTFEERYDFGTLFNGLSVVVRGSDAARLARLPGVAAVFPVVHVSIPETEWSATPELFTALAMTGADAAQSELGLTGAGIKVGVLDTGIDYHHPDLGGGFGPGSRVAYGYDFVGDGYSAETNPFPMPDADPDDCNGHGTHVAGIVGANGTVVGVAPEVTLGAYRVFGCDGSTSADIMILAMERAFADGMDVLNMSLGSAFQWPQYPTAVAASNLVDAGMVVVASIGNSGANGLYSAGAPGLGDQVIGVASFDNTFATQSVFTVSPDGLAIGFGFGTPGPRPPTSGTLPLARTGTTTTADDACAPIDADLTGQAVLIRRGSCTFATKALNAQQAGAAAVVLYNNAAGPFGANLTDAQGVLGIPVVTITGADGALLDARIADGGVELTWTDQVVQTANPTGGLISSFSSYGLSPDLALKPDLGAPGGTIYATYPLELGGFASLSGTSMAAPHVAGAVALLLEARPNLAARDVRGLLQNHADPMTWWGNPGLGFLDNVHRQGAGMLDVDGAILATARIEPAKLSLGESASGPSTATLRLSNDGTEPVTYDVTHVPALATGPNTFTPGFFAGFASVSFSSATVTVPAGGGATVSATIAANPSLDDLSQYGGYLVFTPQGGGAPLRVPYAGLKGDYQAKQVLTPGDVGFPLLGWTPDGSNFGIAGAGDVFTMEGLDLPFVLAHLDHPAQYLEMRIHTVVRGRTQVVHPVFHTTNAFSYLPRSATTTGFFAFAWDGTRYHAANANGNGRQEQRFKVVPNGEYALEVRVLKALGDPANPAHWETWTSPTFRIARP